MTNQLQPVNRKDYVIQNTRIFDGTRVLAENSVLIQNGKIVSIGRDIKIPDGAFTIDGTDCTLLPGLIDSHVHVLNDGALEKSLIFGVTTVMDMGTISRFYSEKKKEQVTGRASNRADIFSGGPLVTAPGGHGTQLGVGMAATISSPEEAQAIVDSQIANGSDYIKIIYDHNLGYPTISKETLATLIDATHKRGKMAIVHAPSLQDARDAIESGVDGLAHLFGGPSPEQDVGRFAAQHEVFIMTTLTAGQSMSKLYNRETLINDENLAPYLTTEDISILKQSLSQFYPDIEPSTSYNVIEQVIQQLKKSGVPILAGTDASDYNFGLMHGVSLHQELELLVEAGLTPAEALSSATMIPAREFNLEDRGMIETGRRADLVLVKGDPTVNIKSTRNIVGVWKSGIPVDRESYRKSIEKQKAELSSQAITKQFTSSESGLVSDFEEDTVTSRFGYGWVAMTDKMMGGKSTSELKIVSGGANNSRGSLMISGEVIVGVQDPWAGAVFYPGSGIMAPADLSDKSEIRFWARGDGEKYNIGLTSISTMTSPASQEFSADAEWKQFSFRVSSFNGMDGSDLMAISFTSSKPGKFSFQIDYVEFK